MNMLEATRFLVLTKTKVEIRKDGMAKLLSKRRRVPGKRVGKLGLTTENSFSSTPNDQSQWVWRSRKITKVEKKKLVKDKGDIRTRNCQEVPIQS